MRLTTDYAPRDNVSGTNWYGVQGGAIEEATRALLTADIHCLQSMRWCSREQ